MRGINVSGQKIIRMENLRATFEALGFRRVRSYVQSGNVIFEAMKSSPDNLSKLIREKILSEYGFSVPVVLRTADEMKKVIGGNPFLDEKGDRQFQTSRYVLVGDAGKGRSGKAGKIGFAP